MNLFNFKTVNDFAESLAGYFPGGKMFRAKNEPLSNLRFLINGLAEEAFRANQLLRGYNDQYYPDGTTDFLEEWERALNIPDECFSVEGSTVLERRRNVVVKLAGMSLQTSSDFVEVAALFGQTIVVLGGIDAAVSPVITPDKTARFTIVIQFTAESGFPFTFPFIFGNDVIALLECIFDKARPANCAVRFDAT